MSKYRITIHRIVGEWLVAEIISSLGLVSHESLKLNIKLLSEQIVVNFLDALGLDGVIRYKRLAYIAIPSKHVLIGVVA